MFLMLTGLMWIVCQTCVLIIIKFVVMGLKYSRLLIERKPSLAFAFHKDGFTLTELQQTFAAFGGQKFSPENKRNFRLWLKNYSDGKGLVIETDKFREGNHRPARIYKPNLEALAEHN